MSTDRDERRGGHATPTVALFIDWDNFAIGLRQEMPDRPADVGPILRWSRRFGVLTVCRAYGEWREPAERLAIYNAGVEVVYAPVLPLGGSVLARAGGGAKSLADTAMAVDVTDLLNLMPSITTVILATSDKDLIPVLRFAQRRGLHAIVVGSDRTAAALRDLADEFISYRQLLEQEGTGAGPQSRPATVPPVRYPRAPRITGILPAPAADREEPARRPRSVVRPLGGTPIGRTAAAAAPAAPAIPAAPDEEDEDEDETGAAGARRRRRGGRRRRGREVTGTDETQAAGADEADEEEQEEDTGAVAVDAGELAASGAEAVEEAEVTRPAAGGIAAPHGIEASVERPTEPVSPGSVLSPATGPTDSPRPMEPADAPPAEPAARRGPVVLPGERLRRLATAPGSEPAAAATETAAAAPAATAFEAPEEPEAPAAEDAGEGEAEPAAGGRARGRRGGRATGSRGQAAKSASKAASKSAAKSAAKSAGEPAAEAAAPAAEASAEGGEPAGEGAGGEPSGGGRGGSRGARGRRRGGRSR